MNGDAVRVRYGILVMGIVREGDGRKLVIPDTDLREAFYIVEVAYESRGPVDITELDSIIVVFHIGIQVIEVQFQLVRVVQPQDRVPHLVARRVELRGLNRGRINGVRRLGLSEKTTY